VHPAGITIKILVITPNHYRNTTASANAHSQVKFGQNAVQQGRQLGSGNGVYNRHGFLEAVSESTAEMLRFS
jgi:hypothetical protein